MLIMMMPKVTLILPSEGKLKRAHTGVAAGLFSPPRGHVIVSSEFFAMTMINKSLIDQPSLLMDALNLEEARFNTEEVIDINVKAPPMMAKIDVI
mmetsp:Transcript_50233/g.90379  ORF Transcript_50233/g.90379 Transcript_50233/m.90379 type:complete len:95 (+) Transcript_50233:100-384(+)